MRPRVGNGPGTAGSVVGRARQAGGLVVQRRRNGYAVPAGWVTPCVVLVAPLRGAPTLGVCLMSVPETESARAGEGAATGAAAAPEKAGSWNDPRLPWHGKPRTADILCWLGIVFSGLFFWVLLPVRVSLVGTHPVVAELLNGSTESIISASAFARVGDGTLAVVLLAAIPGLMKFDILFWWAGRLWGERFIMALPGSRRVAKYMARVRQADRRFAWPAMLVSSFLPIPRAI